jgi:hypothetical protein
MITDGLARDLARYDREITRTHYEQEQDESIADALTAVNEAWEGKHDDRFDRLMATRDAAQDVIDACNCGLMDKYK